MIRLNAASRRLMSTSTLNPSSRPSTRGLHLFTLLLHLRLSRGINMVASVVAGDKTAQSRLIKWTIVKPLLSMCCVKNPNGVPCLLSSLLA
jgi:hypothetical protein